MAEKRNQKNLEKKPLVKSPLPQKREVKKFEFKLQFDLKKILIWILIILVGLSILGTFWEPAVVGEEIPFSAAIEEIKKGEVDEVIVEKNRLILKKDGGEERFAFKEEGVNILEIFKETGIETEGFKLTIRNMEAGQAFWNILEILLPIGATFLIFYFIFRQARGSQDAIFSFGRSRARLFSRGKQKMTFKDVGGIEEAKKELEEIVDFLKHPQKYKKLGARTPKGVLLVGHSGTGKTLLARAVAGEAGVPFFSMAGSEFMEMLVGVGPSRVRDLFLTAKRAAPAIIFIDEIDAIGRARGMGFAGGHGEQEQTLNQILVEMDGFTPNDNVIVMAASVTGETPVLIKESKETKVLPIGEFIDQFFDDDNQEGEKEVKGVYCLGFEKRVSQGNLTKNNLYFDHSALKKVRSIFRHKVKEVYEIEYLGGKIRATGNHSVFVRSPRGLVTKAVIDLKPGDILIDLPYKVNRTNKRRMEIRKHQFDSSWSLKLPIFDPEIEHEWQEKYLLAVENEGYLSQSEIAAQIGVSQGTISYWQRGGRPRPISKAYFKHDLPEEVEVTPDLCRLMGYYVAEGYARKEVDFCFSINEGEKIEDLIFLMEEIFGIKPDFVRHITPGAVNIVYGAAPLAKFFIRYCGKGAFKKHVPGFLFEAPFVYYKEFWWGVFNGDGYEDKWGRGEITSVSKQLIEGLNWLCRMHGIKTYMGSFVAKEGRRIKDGKPLKATQAYRLGWGKANNPSNKYPLKKTYPVKRAIIKNIKKLPFDGFVYDLCGVENEAFFGGKSPILLHNTNRPDFLDPALVRPGRFDRRVILDLPDIEERKKILKIHSRGKPFVKDVDWEKAAKRTVGFSGADLENMLNEAAILAARENKGEIDMEDIEEAATKVKLGPEKRRLQSKQEKKMTAYHEAGHAVVAHLLPKMDLVHRVSIVSRGLALGFTLISPERDKYQETKTELLEKVTALLGGRAAEELVFKEFTGGAASDIDQATRIVRQMVVEYGMSDLGPIYLGPQIEQLDWGGSFARRVEVSEELQAKVDKEIEKIVGECYERAKKILEESREKLDLVAERLVEQETIEGEEFRRLVTTQNEKLKTKI